MKCLTIVGFAILSVCHVIAAVVQASSSISTSQQATAANLPSVAARNITRRTSSRRRVVSLRHNKSTTTSPSGTGANQSDVERLYRDSMTTSAFRYTRLGFTESTLLLIHILREKLGIILPSHDEMLSRSIKWLYSTSGFYDKSIRGTYFNFDGAAIIKSVVFNAFVAKMIDSIHGSSLACFRLSANTTHNFDRHFSAVAGYLGLKSATDCLERDAVIDRINNRKVLIVSAFAPLIAEQITSGNAQKAYPAKKFTIPSVVSYRTNYTFFNNKYGNESHFFVTLNRMCREVKLIDPASYDIALISVGAYSTLMAGCIAAKHQKDTMTLGSHIQNYFAILNTRTKDSYVKTNRYIPNEAYWIKSIPDEYKPIDYKKIEGGCYW